MNLLNWACLWLQKNHEDRVIAVCGPDFRKKIGELRKNYKTDLLYFGSEGPSELAYLQHRFVEGKNMIYYCTGKECKLPTEDPAEILKYFS